MKIDIEVGDRSGELRLLADFAFVLRFFNRFSVFNGLISFCFCSTEGISNISQDF